MILYCLNQLTIWFRIHSLFQSFYFHAITFKAKLTPHEHPISKPNLLCIKDSSHQDSMLSSSFLRAVLKEYRFSLSPNITSLYITHSIFGAFRILNTSLCSLSEFLTTKCPIAL